MKTRVALAGAVSIVTAGLAYIGGFLSAATWRGCLTDCEGTSGNHGAAIVFWIFTAVLAVTGPALMWWATRRAWTVALAVVLPALAGVGIVIAL